MNAKAAWERRAGETAKQYAAFCEYRVIPAADRSIDAAWKKYKVGTTSITPGYFRHWAADNEWVARALAYDMHIEEQARAAYEAERLKQRDTRQKVVQALNGLLGRVMAVQAQEGLTPQELNALAMAASRVLNESRVEFDDLPTQRVKSEVSGPEGAPMRVQVVYATKLPELGAITGGGEDDEA